MRKTVPTTLVVLLAAAATLAAPAAAPHTAWPARPPTAPPAQATSHAHGPLIDTLPAHCGAGQPLPTQAWFTLTLRRAGPDAPPAAPQRLALLDRGVARFALRVWVGNEPAGSVKTLSLDLAAWQPPGGAPRERGRGGHGLWLLRDRGLSFSLSARGELLSAQLTYRCAGDRLDRASITPAPMAGAYPGADALEAPAAPPVPDPGADAWRALPPRLRARPGAAWGD